MSSVREFRDPPWTLVVAAVAAETGVSRADILSDSRLAPIAEARQIAMYVLRRAFHFSLPEAGRRLGGRDHTTVLHAERKIADRIAADWRWASRVGRIIAAIVARYAGASEAVSPPAVLARPLIPLPPVHPVIGPPSPSALAASAPAKDLPNPDVPWAAILTAVERVTAVPRGAILAPLFEGHSPYRFRVAEARELVAFVLCRVFAEAGAAAGQRMRQAASMASDAALVAERRVQKDWAEATRLAQVLAALVAVLERSSAPPRAVIAPALTRTGARVIVHHRRTPVETYDFGDPPPDLVARRNAAGFATSGQFRVPTSQLTRVGW